MVQWVIRVVLSALLNKTFLSLCFLGITQEEIDETRLQTEKLMLTDLKKVAKDRKALEKKDENGVTPVGFRIN